MSKLEDWCNDKGLSQQQKVEVKKHIRKDGGESVRDKKLFDFLSEKTPPELAKSNYLYMSCDATVKVGGGPNNGSEKKPENK